METTTHSLRRSALRLGIAAFSLGTLAMPAAWAQQTAWPTKPVNLIVPWPAGGPSDSVARQGQNDTQKALGQTLIIENVGGVGGAMGVQKMLTGNDGHTLLLGSPFEYARQVTLHIDKTMPSPTGSKGGAGRGGGKGEGGSKEEKKR